MIGISALLGHLGRLVNRRDLRHADAGNDPRGADRARPDAHLHGVGPGGDQVAAALGRGHVAGDHVDVPLLLDLLTVSITLAEWPWALSTTSTSTPLSNQAVDPLVIVDADGRTDPQPALPIFAGLRKAPHHINVFDRDESRQPKIFVNQQKLLHLFCH